MVIELASGWRTVVEAKIEWKPQVHRPTVQQSAVRAVATVPTALRPGLQGPPAVATGPGS